MKSKALSMFATALTVCCLFAVLAHGQVDVVRYEDVVRNTRGDVIGGATISVYAANTTTPATIYSSSLGVTTKANPLSSDTAGRFWFYATAGTYDVRVTGNGITTYTLEDVDLTGGAFAREATDPQLLYGDGAPVAPAPVGSIYQRGDAVPDSALYIQGPVDWYSVMMPVNRSGSEYAQFGDQSPDVSGTDFLIFSNHAPTSVSFFDGGVDGQILSVYLSDNYTILAAGPVGGGGLFQPSNLSGQGIYCVYRFASAQNSWFLLWSSQMGTVAQDYYLDNWDPYGVDATMPVLSDPQFWPGWDAEAPLPLYNLVSGSCVAALDSTVVLALNVTANEPVIVSTMVISGSDTTITNYAGSYSMTPQRSINTGESCVDGDSYRVNYKLADSSGHESPWWYGGSFTVVIDDYDPVILANLVGDVSVVGSCDGTADVDVWFNTDIMCDANYIWTKVGSGDTSTVEIEGTGSFHLFEIATDSTCTNGSAFSVFFSLTNADDETGQRYGPYTYTVSGLDETAPSQGVPTLTGQCSNSLVAMQLSVTSAEPCYLSAQWRLGSTGTWVPVSGQTAFNVLHNVAISTNLACVNNQVFYVQYRLTDQFQNTSAWFSGGSYTVSVTPPPGDTMWPIINSAGCSVVATVVNGFTVLTVTIDADETFSAYARAVSGTNTITFGVPQEAAGSVPVFNDPCTRVINTGVTAVQGQTWVVSATMWDDETTPNYTSPPYSNYVGTAIVDMTPTFGPAITAISGTASDGQTITITGSNFGVKSPAAPLVWDDFEDGTDGDEISDTWSTQSLPVVYSDDMQRGVGNMSAFQDYQTPAQGSPGIMYCLPPFSELYVSGYWYHQIGGSLTDNFKIINFTSATPGCNYGAPHTPQCRVDLYPLRSDGSSGGHLYVDNSDGSSFGTYSVGGDSRPGNWQRIERYMRPSSIGVANGRTWVKRDLEMWGELNNVLTYTDSDVYTMLLITHFFRRGPYQPTPWMLSYWDELYVDTTLARVEIGDSPDWDSCTHREIQIPATWASGSMAVMINQGTFDSGDVSYVFVTDSQDRHSVGFPVTWGGAVTPGDVTPPSLVPNSLSYNNVSWGAAGVDSLAVITGISVSEPAKVVSQILVTTINGDVATGYTYEPADTTGNWTSTYSATFSDTLFTEESWADTIGYVTRFMLEDRAGNKSAWINSGTSGFGMHEGVPDDTPEEPTTDTVYYMFGYGIPANHPVVAGTPYLTGHVVQDSLYYFQWSGRRGSASATSTTATTYFSSAYEFGGYSDPLAGGFATTDSSTIAFSGIASADRLSGLGQYITEAKFYFRMGSTTDINTYGFTPAPNFYAAAVCTNSVLFEAEAVAMGNPPPYNYITNNISYNTVGEGTWDAARTSFDSLAKYGIGVNTQQTFIWSGAPWGIESWFVHDFTEALQTWYAEPNDRGIIIAQMGHAPGTTGPAYPDFAAWRSSGSGILRPVLLVKLEIPRTAAIPASAIPPNPGGGGGKEPDIIQEP